MDKFYYCIGFTAQILFFARFLIQWLLSEKTKHVVSPAIFWKLSLIASFLLFIYGFLRDDFAIILGQTITYYIYIWNLNNQNNWKKFSVIIRYMFILMPLVVITHMAINWNETVHRLFMNDDIPLILLLWGIIGQIVFTFRFIYQLIYSMKRKESSLPKGFWIISIIGASLIFSYGLFRHDPVLIIGQGFGFLIYSRNLFIIRKQAKDYE